MYKNARVLIGPGSMPQRGYLKGGTKKLENSNTADNNAYAAYTKTKSASLKKQGQKQPKFTIKKHLDKAFTKITLFLLKPKILWFVYKNYNIVSDIPEV